MADTIFAKIIRREIPADILYEDDDVLAFTDVSPQAPEHFLVIPKQAIATVNDIQPEQAELIGKMVLAAQTLAKDKGIAEDGYRLVMNCNEGAGQTVFHIHLQVLGGRPMNWRPGENELSIDRIFRDYCVTGFCSCKTGIPYIPVHKIRAHKIIGNDFEQLCWPAGRRAGCPE